MTCVDVFKTVISFKLFKEFYFSLWSKRGCNVQKLTAERRKQTISLKYKIKHLSYLDPSLLLLRDGVEFDKGVRGILFYLDLGPDINQCLQHQVINLIE